MADSNLTHQHGTISFGELACNAEADVSIESQAYLENSVAFSQLADAMEGSMDGVLVVPCGTCYTVNCIQGEVITLPPGGMDVLGRLHFPLTANVVLNATGIIVRGLVEISHKLNPVNRVIVTLCGTENVLYYPHDICGGWS